MGKSGTTINLFGIELDDIITLNNEMVNVLVPGLEIILNQTSDMVSNSLVCQNPRLEPIDDSFPLQAALYSQYKINCEVDDPEGFAEGDFEIEVKIPFQPDFESDYWMSGPVIWEMNP